MPFLARELDLSPALIGLVLATAAIGGLAGAAIAGRLAARMGIGRAVAVGNYGMRPIGALAGGVPEHRSACGPPSRWAL